MLPPVALDHDSLRALSVRSSLRGFSDAILVWGVIVLAVVGAQALHRWYGYVIAIVVIGSRQNALATLAHEAWHGLIVPSQPVNHALGAWLYAYPIGIPYYHDRSRHLRHHRTVGHDYDPDWINYSTQSRESPLRVLRYFASLLFGSLLFSTLVNLVRRGQPRIGVGLQDAGEKHLPVFSEFLRVLLCQAVLFGVMTLAFGWWTYPLLWLLPLATFAGFFANFRSFVEHVTPTDAALPEQRLRDIRAGALERFFISPSHFNYHALHHAHPSIPHYNLPQGKNAYVKNTGSYPFAVWPGYCRALLGHFRELRTQASSAVAAHAE